MLNLILVSSIVIVSLSLSLESGCPSVQSVQFTYFDFNPGMWYQIAKYPNNTENLQKCLGYYITPNGNGFKAVANISNVSPNFSRAEGKLIENGRGAYNFTGWIENPYKVVNLPEMYYLAFEHNKFFIAYGCINGPTNEDYREYIWIFSKTTNVPRDTKEKLDNIIISSNVIDMNKLTWVDHSNCISA